MSLYLLSTLQCPGIWHKCNRLMVVLPIIMQQEYIFAFREQPAWFAVRQWWAAKDWRLPWQNTSTTPAAFGRVATGTDWQTLSLAGAATSIIFVMTNTCLLQQNMCFVMTKVCLSQQNLCHDKHVCCDKTSFVVTKNMLVAANMTNVLSRQTILSQQKFCHVKHTFVATKDVLCHNKHVFAAHVCHDKTSVMTKMILMAAPANDRHRPADTDWQTQNSTLNHVQASFRCWLSTN